jgi:endonuclease-3
MLAGAAACAFLEPVEDVEQPSAASKGNGRESGEPNRRKGHAAPLTPARRGRTIRPMTAASKLSRKKRALAVVEGLKREYPSAECALVHDTPFELLIATILSAQCTDERVNIVTKELFAKYPTPAQLAAVPIGKLEKLIQSTGFFRNKAKNIHACCRELVAEHGGQVPADMDKLVKLPGVGRKTANVVLGTAFRIASGVVVDTHVTRVSQRLGLTDEEDAVKIERDLIALLPQEEWIDFSHRMIWHGRRVCKARKPLCGSCVLNEICPKIGVE